MSTEIRTDDGYPLVDGPRTRPRARIECHPGAALTGPTNIDQSHNKTSNPALPWLTAIMAGAAFGGVLIAAVLQPWKAEDRAAQAELRAEFAQRIARTEALSELARKEASTAVDTVDVEVQRRKAREEMKR